jgi:3-oxoacyl-(acyl-carrier-protein) synthase
MRAVVVSGLGLVTSIGSGSTAVLAALRELRTGIRPWDPLPGTDLPVKVAGPVDGYDLTAADSAGWQWPDNAGIDPSLVRGMPPHGLYAMAALHEALSEAGLSMGDCGDGRCGLYTASGGSHRLTLQHLSAMARTGWRRGHPLGVVSSIAGTLSFHLAAMLGIRGESCGFVSACASSAHALGYAADAIRLGRQDRVVVIGAEDLSLESAMPFHAMGALSTAADPVKAVRPFDRERNGFAASGGAAVMILESADAAAARGVKPLAFLRGWGQAADGFHPAAPHPQGAGLEQAMRLAMTDAAITPADLGYVNAHAPGTVAGDAAEALALRRFLGNAAPAISSTKALTGHTLSMAGTLEAAICVLALRHGFIPGQAHLADPLAEGTGLHFPRQTLQQPPGFAMNLNSGFGGANVAMIFSHA